MSSGVDFDTNEPYVISADNPTPDDSSMDSDDCTNHRQLKNPPEMLLNDYEFTHQQK